MKKNKPVVFEQFQTLLNRDVQFKGTIQIEEDMLIAGTVDGDIRGKKSLHLLSSAQVRNRIEVENCTIYGATVDGTVKLYDRLKMYSGSTLNGSIEAEVLDVEAGARINGTIKMHKKGDAAKKTRAPSGEA